MIENHKDKSKSSQIHHEKTISLPNAHIFPKLFSNTIFPHSFSIENLTFELLPTLLVPQAQIARFMLLQVLELYFINRMEDIQCIFQSMNTKGSIFISNIEAAKNISLLQDKNIRAILSVARSGLIYHTKQQIPYYLYLPIEDREDFQISQYFHETFQFIQRARRQTNVLIHCMVGVSRSVTIAIAYLLRKFRYGLGQVINLIQRKRKKINPNPGFLRQLRKYSQNLGIKCDFHENAIQPFRQTSVSKNKRSLSAGKQKNIGKKQHLSPITAIIVQKQKVVFDGGLSIKDENLSTVKKSVIELRKIKSYQQKGKDNVQQMQGTKQSIQKCQMKKSVSIEEKKGRRRSSIEEKISKIREKILKKEGEKNSKSLFNSPNKEQKQSMYESYSKTSKLKVQQLSLQLHRTKTPIKQDEQKPFQKQSSNIRPLNDLAKYYQQQRNSHFFTAQLKIQSKSFYSKNSRMNPRFIFRTKQQQQ